MSSYARTILLPAITFLCSLFIFSTSTLAINPPSFTILSEVEPTGVDFNNTQEERITEITPWALENKTKTGGNHLFLVSSNKTFLCEFPDNIFGSIFTSTVSSCKLRQGSTINRQTVNNTYDTTLPLWRRDFYGAFSGHIVVTDSGTLIYAINHGELLNNDYFMPLGQPCYPTPNIGYWIPPCDGQPENVSYNAFVTMSSFNFGRDFYSQTPFTDLGPVVWPANGYVDAGKKATYLGILHPSSIIKDGYLYVFFRDTSLGQDSEGRGPGPKVARAPITSTGVDPKSFKTYYNGAFTDSALPQGFDKNNIMNYFNKKGGRSSSLFVRDYSPQYITNTYSFAVAKIKNNPGYLGVSNDLIKGLSFRFSLDLVNWSNDTVLSQGGAAGDSGPFMYARLADINGDSSSEIDPQDFYVIGTQNHIVNKMHLKLNNLPTFSGDLNADGKVNIYDYVKLLNGFNVIYFADDFAKLLSNYGM